MRPKPETTGINKYEPRVFRHGRLRAGVFALAATLGIFGDRHMPDIELFNHRSSPDISSDSIEIMTANVHGWVGYNGNNFDDFSAALEREKPDVVCMQEVLADGEELRKLYQQGYNVLFSTTIRYPFRGRFGNAILSKAPLSLVKVVKLPNRQTVTPRNGVLFAVETEAGKLDFFNTHLSTSLSESTSQTARAFDEVGDLMQGACGDFNQTPAQLASGRFGRMMSVEPAYYAFSTFPAAEPSRRIDYVLSECGVIDSTKSHQVYIGSDHLAVSETMDISACHN